MFFAKKYGKKIKKLSFQFENSVFYYDLSGNRTRVSAVRGRRLDRLTNRPLPVIADSFIIISQVFSFVYCFFVKIKKLSKADFL